MRASTPTSAAAPATIFWKRSALTAPEHFGGQDLPESFGAALKEMIDAACLSWGNYPLLSHGATEALPIATIEAREVLGETGMVVEIISTES